MRRGRWIAMAAATVLLASLLPTPQPGLAQGKRPGSEVGTMQAPFLSYLRITNNSLDDLSPATAYNTLRHEYFVVWQAPAGGGNGGVYGQRVDLNGNLVGGMIPIDTVGVNWAPAVAYNSKWDEYLVVYTHNAISSGDYDVYARVVTGAGGVGGLTLIDTAFPTKQSYPAVAYNSQDDNYLIVYQSETSADFYVIRGQSRAADMSLLVPRTTFPSGKTSRQNADVAYNQTRGQYLVVYDRRNNSERHGDILGQLVAQNLGFVGGELRICTDPHLDQYQPAVAAGPDEFLVVWSDGNGDNPPTNYNIYGSRVRGDGSLPGGASNRGSPIAYDGTNNRFAADLAYADGWGYFVAWHYYSGLASGWDIWGNHWVPGLDQPAGAEFVLDNSPHDQYSPAVACQPGGDCFFADEDYGYSVATSEITGWWMRLQKAYLPLTVR